MLSILRNMSLTAALTPPRHMPQKEAGQAPLQHGSCNAAPIPGRRICRLMRKARAAHSECFFTFAFFSLPMAKNAKGEWAHPGQRQWDDSRWFNWWFLPAEVLGMAGPLIGAAISLFATIICLWIVKFANAILQSEFLSLMIGAVDRNIMWFLIVPLVIGYCQYFAKRVYIGHVLLQPVGNAVGFTFSMWIIAWLLRTAGATAGVPLLSQIGATLRENILPIFAIVLALGYVLVLARRR